MTDYESGLDEDVVNDQRYEFRLRAAVELAPKNPNAIAMQFMHYSDLTAEERATLKEMDRRGQVIVRDREQPVSGLNRTLASLRPLESRSAYH